MPILRRVGHDPGAPAWCTGGLPYHESIVIVIGIEIEHLAPLVEIGLAHHAPRLVSGLSQGGHENGH